MVLNLCLLSAAHAADDASTDAAIRKAADEFRRRDADRNEQLSLEELFANQPEKSLPRLRQGFRIVDYNGDGQLSWDEYRTVPGRLPREKRGAVADPIATARDAAWKQWQAIVAAADNDSDGSLSEREWSAERLAAALPLFAQLRFGACDRDGDGKITEAEGRWLVDVAYGFIRPDGSPLRTAEGMVLDWTLIRGLDTNSDGILSRDEFVPRYWAKEKNADIFARHDTDGDGQLTRAELEPIFWVDLLARFFGIDADRDGLLSPAELFKDVGSWGGRVVERTVPAFDDDGDGKLSWLEYRSTTFANMAGAWHLRRLDADSDCRLSWREFYQEPTPVLIGLARHVFDHFDLDDDGFLSFAEYEFNTDFRRVAPDTAFWLNDLDGDGWVSQSELTIRTGRPAAEVKRDFLLFDRDADGRLGKSEFRTLPTVAAVYERGPLADPVVKLAERYLALFDERRADWDADQSGLLSRAEFAQGVAGAIELPAVIGQIPVDLNNDGVVMREEMRSMLERSLGVRHSVQQLNLHNANDPALFAGAVIIGAPVPGGRRAQARQSGADMELRLPGGGVLNLVQFRNLDQDRSASVDRAEFDRLKLPAAQAAEQFLGADADRDGRLTLEEWWRVPAGAYDAVVEFRYLDRDRDGWVSPQELLTISVGRQKLAAHIFPGFDLDGDGKLSLPEYCFSPLANPLVNWYQEARDIDGKLTFDEFPGGGGLFELLRWHYFERLDLNADGVLDTDEFYFRVRTPHILYTLNADGTGWRKLFELDGYLNCGSPMVSPDGKTLAFDAWQILADGQQGTPTVFAIDIDGGNCRKLCQGQMPSWSPDGKSFVCSRAAADSSVAIMAADDGAEVRPVSNDWSGQWSPDGKKIACYSGNRLLVYDVQTNQPVDVLGPNNRYRQIFWNMCWSPDSRQICFKAGMPDGTFDLVLVNAAGAERGAAGAERGLKVRLQAASFNAKFAWHPTQSRLVLSMSCPERRVNQLYQLDPQTHEPPTLVPGQDPTKSNVDPCWTPDGKRLILIHGGW